MSKSLRKPWVSKLIVEKLNEALKRRDEESLKADEIFEAIGPSGELRLPGDTTKKLQVIEIDSVEDPCTVIMSDKSVKVVCRISAEARQKYETSSGTKISAIKGGIAKLKSFEIYFFGVDGRLFWKGATYRSQIADEPASQKGIKAAKKDAQNSNAGGKSTEEDLRAGGRIADTELFPKPEPILYITDFDFLFGTQQDIVKVWGKPVSVSSKVDLKALLLDLPRKASSWKEFTLSQSGVFSSRKNASSASSKWSTGDQTSDNEMRSQPDVYSGEVSSQEVSQLPFTTQAHAHHLETFDDLEFSHDSQKKKPGAKPPLSPIQKPSGVSVQGKKKIQRPQHARKNAEQTKSLNTKPKFINYADRSDSEGSLAGPAIRESGSKNLANNTNNQKRKRGGHSTSGSGSDVGRKGKRSLVHPGWLGMRQITRAETIIPKDQQEILNRPESWYPYENNHYFSGYDFVPKDQLVPKSHPPREPKKQSNFEVVVPPVTTSGSPIPSTANTEISWPSSSVKSPLRKMDAKPPDSSFRSDTQSPLAGRWSKETNILDAQVSSNDNSFNQPSQVSIQEVEKNEHKIPRAQPRGETYEKYEFKGKRVTRAANGISKKTPVDPNNVEPSRMAKASKKQRLPVVWKQRSRHEYRSEESENYQSSGDENINELINHPNLPVGVVDPNGRTRVDVFGGILKAQQVNLWEQNGKQPQKRQDEDENEDAQSDTDYDDDGDFDDLIWDKQGSDEGIIIDGNIPMDPIKEVVGVTISETQKMSPQAKKPEHQHTDPRTLPAENSPPDNLAVDHLISNHHPKTVGHPPSPQPSGTLLSEGENDKLSESLPGSSIELSMAEHLGAHKDDDDDEDEIPQAPLMPLNPALSTARAQDTSGLQFSCPDEPDGGSIEIAQNNIAPQTTTNVEIVAEPDHKKGDSFSTALLLQDPPAPEAPNISKSQKFDENIITASFSSSISITAPSIQVKETPYGKEVGNWGEDLSPTTAKSKSRTDFVCANGEFDLTLIPGTNMEEPHKSQEYISSPLDQNPPTTSLLAIPERQITPPDHSRSSVESKNLQNGSPDDFRSQEQLMREAQEHRNVEVPATLEVDEARTKDDILSFPTPARRVRRSGPKKVREVLGSVDFGTQEIRAATNTRSVVNMLEEQKREFMGLTELPSFTHTAEQGKSSLSERPVVGPGTKKYTLSNPGGESLATSSHLPRSNDEEMASDITQPNIRKRTQLPSSKPFIAAKKPRVVSPYKTTCVPTLPHSEKQKNIKASAKPQTESSPKSRMESLGEEDFEEERSEKGKPGQEDFVEKDYMKENSIERPFEEKDLELSSDENDLEESFELSDDDPMAGFPDIDLSDDEPMVKIPEIIDLTSDSEKSCKSPGPSQTQSKPELYAGLRMRTIRVPGYEKLTDEQKEALDKRRQEYFGVKPSSERLFSVELQRAMSKANLKERKVEDKKAEESQGNEWYRDKDTPVKKFFRQFQEMERSKMAKAELNKQDE